MNNLTMIFVAVVAGLAVSDRAAGQDWAIVQERPATGTNAPVAITRSGSLVPGESIPNSISDPMHALERILAAPNPGIADQEGAFRDVMKHLNAIGVPVVLHDTARDDELDEDTVVRGVGLADQPLYVQLALALEKYNASLQLRDGYALVISKDAEDDPGFFVTITYDVSALANFEGHTALAGVISQTVNPDQWAATGTGDQTISFSFINNHNLMSISAPWSEHLQIRKFLTQLRHLSAGEMPLGSVPTGFEPGTSQFANIRAVWQQQPPAEAPRNTGGGAFKVDDR